VKTPFKTSPHGEHEISQLEKDDNGDIRNRLFQIKNSSGIKMIFTGEELNSLCDGWKNRNYKGVS